ncbi:bifunctional lysylphosphatidylglycerol flippase/synthetase MprF [Gimesia fumaroli]|uniref:Phosphatidylglycerol lysyltransferase n=1 Tax=Gimesia fumaroli TaxID=2527976 RepID=A0A518IJ70_9PLAN|nr:DUF2156 domain-containing protein [Gimesia fumaroli]QDV53115.1 Phosphatidylglycerol lysyltransferase [Gimesia fumaroli]
MSTSDPSHLFGQNQQNQHKLIQHSEDETLYEFPFQDASLRVDSSHHQAPTEDCNQILPCSPDSTGDISESELREFIFQHGRYFDSYLATEPGRLSFWSRGRRGLISYKRWRKHVIIGGGLIAPEHHKPQLVTEFLEYARQNRLSVAFHNIGEEDLSFFQDFQFQITKWGEDPMIDLESCTWQGKEFEWVRRQTNYCLRQGVTACEVRPDQLHPVQWLETISEVIQVANESLTRKPQKKTMQFFEGRIDNHDLGLRRLFIARRQGRIEGFVICNPILNGTGWATELYRHRLDSVKGTMAFLIHHVLQQLKQEGVQKAGLCLDLGRDCHPLPGDSFLVRQGLVFAEKHLTSIFDFTGLRHFKSRFRPQYEKRFACVYPKVTIGSLLAFASTTGVLDLHYGRFARNLYDQLRKRTLRKNLTQGKKSGPVLKCEQSGEINRKFKRSA